MKTVIYLLLLYVIANNQIFAETGKLKTFDEILGSLKNGKNVRVIIDYSKTKLILDGEEVKAPAAIGGMNLDIFEFFDKMSVRNERAFISISETVLISHPAYGYVLNYVKMRIYDDNKIEIIARYLDPKTYEVKMDETFYTEIKNDNNEAGAEFFGED